MDIDLTEFNKILDKLKIVVKNNSQFGFGAYLFVFKDKLVTCNESSRIIFRGDFSELDDEFAIEFDKLDKFCKGNKKGNTIKLSTTETSAIFKIGTSKITMQKNIGIFENFKNEAMTFNWDGFEALPEDFVEAIEIAKGYAGTDPNKSATNYIKIEDDTVEATNSIVLCEYFLEDNMNKMFLRYDIAGNVATFNPTRYKIDDDLIYFESDNMYFVTVPVDSKFFDFEMVFKRFSESYNVEFSEDVFDKIDVANIANGKDKECKITLLIKNGECTFFADKDTLVSQATCGIKSDTNDLLLKGNAKLLKTLFECSLNVKVLKNFSSALANNDKYRVALALMM